MFSLKQLLHESVVRLADKFSGLIAIPIPVTFGGAGASSELVGSIAQMRIRKLLIVTDAMLVEIGIVGQVTTLLDGVGVGWSIYSGVQPDPTFRQVEEGLAQLQREDCDAVLAVGGGSSMDAAKVIAAMASSQQPLSKLEGMFKLRKATLRLFALPTTAGTGSEVTIVAVLSDPESHEKKFFIDPKLVPTMTALDPELMLGLPPQITAATGMDALTHAVESFISKSTTPVSEEYAKIAVRSVFDHLQVAYADGKNLDARKAMALASYYGGLAFTRTSVGYVHAIAHTLGAYYGTPHGLANAIVLPLVLEFSLGPAEERLAELADCIGCEAGNRPAQARAFIASVRELMMKIDIPNKLEALREADIRPIAKQALAEAHMNYPVPRYMSQSECETLLRQLCA